jgi:hypothetical protein
LNAWRRKLLNESNLTIHAPGESGAIFGSAVRAEHLGAEFTTIVRKWLSKAATKETRS